MELHPPGIVEQDATKTAAYSFSNFPWTSLTLSITIRAAYQVSLILRLVIAFQRSAFKSPNQITAQNAGRCNFMSITKRLFLPFCFWNIMLGGKKKKKKQEQSHIEFRSNRCKTIEMKLSTVGGIPAPCKGQSLIIIMMSP